MLLHVTDNDDLMLTFREGKEHAFTEIFHAILPPLAITASKSPMT